MTTSKPYTIDKQAVWEAWKQGKANHGAAGIDGETIAAFEQRLQDNLYKLWNRMSSGSYFPPPVRQVEIPKGDGRVRTLGVPTVADRIAQTVVKRYLEPVVEPLFHPDSYGYRPGRSARQAVGVCRERCWQEDWLIDLDLRAFFDTLDHALVLKAVRHHTDLPWIALYIERWLTAPVQMEDGTLVERKQGSPQGSAISPLLANLYLHWAFDAWMQRAFLGIRFERYCDDIVVHCRSQQQARHLLEQISERLAACGLDVNQAKTRIVYCQDDRRNGHHAHVQFDFLGYILSGSPSRRSGPRKPRSSVPRSAEREVVPGVQPGHQRPRVEAARAGDQTLAPAAVQRSEPGRPGRPHQCRGARMAHLLRTLLPVRAEAAPRPDQRASGAVGTTEVQTVAGPSSARLAVFGERGNPSAATVRALGAGSATEGWVRGAG
jgi:RNA-directed DNA polymerase